MNKDSSHLAVAETKSVQAHTPGPLIARVGSNGDVGIIATAENVIAFDDIGGALIAECYCEIRRAGEGAQAEALANAMLFAAAPELLAACQAMVRYQELVESGATTGLINAYAEAFEGAEDAIAKAGQQGSEA
jgi:hypothetical protein